MERINFHTDVDILHLCFVSMVPQQPLQVAVLYNETLERLSNNPACLYIRVQLTYRASCITYLYLCILYNMYLYLQLYILHYNHYRYTYGYIYNCWYNRTDSRVYRLYCSIICQQKQKVTTSHFLKCLLFDPMGHDTRTHIWAVKVKNENPSFKFCKGKSLKIYNENIIISFT